MENTGYTPEEIKLLFEVSNKNLSDFFIKNIFDCYSTAGISWNDNYFFYKERFIKKRFKEDTNGKLETCFSLLGEGEKKLFLDGLDEKQKATLQKIKTLKKVIDF